MADIAALGFQIDSSSLAEAKEHLGGMTSAAGDTEKAVRNLAQYARVAAQTIANENKSAADAVDAVKESYDRAQSSAASAAAEAQRAGREGSNAGQESQAANDNAATSVDRHAEAWRGLWGIIKTVITTLAAYFTLSAFLKSTIESEESVARLNVVLSATGGISGQTSDSLGRLTEELLAVSTFGKDAIQSAEAIMLSFTRIGGEVFPRATKAAADLAARMGTDIPSAARMIGRALEEPVRGMQMLQRAGIILSDAQREQIKHFAALNDAAGAQGVILQAIESNSAGAAAALRNTLGGALTAFRRDFSDAFQVSANASEPLRQSIEGLDEAVRSEGFKQFVNLIGTILFTALRLVADAVTFLIRQIQDLMANLQNMVPGLLVIGTILAAVFGPIAIALVVGFFTSVTGGFVIVAAAAAIFATNINRVWEETFGESLQTTLKNVFNFVVQGFQIVLATIQTMVENFPDVVTAMGEDIQKNWTQVENFFAGSWERIKSFTLGWVETIKQGVRDIVAYALSYIPDGLKAMWGIGAAGAVGGNAQGGLAGANGVLGANAGAPSLERAVPAPSEPPGVSTGDFGSDQRATNRIAERGAQLKKTIDEIRASNPAGAVAGAVRTALAGAAQVAEDAKAKITGMAPALGAMATGARAAGQAHQDAFSKAIEYANDFIAKQNAAAAAVGMTGVAAKTLTYETELLNKATANNAVLTQSQREQIHAAAVAMAEASNKADLAKFMHSASEDASRFIQNENLLQRSVFMSAEAAQAARIEQDLLNKARQQGLELGPSQIAQIQQNAAAMAAAAQQTKALQELGNLARSSFSGFFSEMAQGLMKGQSLWDALGQAAMNTLNNVTNKLIDMAANQLMDAAFGVLGGNSKSTGSSGGSLGIAGAILGGLSSLFGFAEGGDYPAGRPRIVGERGPEIDLPNTSGTVLNAAQLAAMVGMGGGTQVSITQTNHFGSDVTTATMARWANEVERKAREGAIAGVAAKRSRGGQMKEVFRR